MKKLLTISTLFLSLLLAFSGCSMSQKPSQKPAPPAKITPTPSDSMTPNKKPATPTHTQASKLAQAAEEVDGVKAATVVVTGTTVMVGPETEPGIENKKTEEIKKQVIKEIKRADNSINTVSVTTDPNLITRLKKIAKGIEEGKPISSFTDELAEITRRITPKTKTNK